MPYDGVAADAPRMYFDDETSRDSNKPFLYEAGSEFVIHGGAIRHCDNQVYSNDDYKVVIGSSCELIDGCEGNIISDTNGIIEFGVIRGDEFSKITARNIVLSWKLVNRHNNSEINVGQTQHFVYAVGGDLSGITPFHTLVDIGCRSAVNRIDADDTFAGIWDYVSERKVYRIDGAGPITYWGPLASVNVPYDPEDPDPIIPWYFTTHGLLKYLDGRCGGWSRFFIDVCNLQGISGITHERFHTVLPNNNNDYRYTIYQKGVLQGQTQHFYSIYENHVINKFNDCFYDVTSGKKYANKFTYLFENSEIEIHMYLNGVISPEILGNRIVLTTTNWPDYIVFE